VQEVNNHPIDWHGIGILII